MKSGSPAMELRPTGISVVGDLPWGTHFCHFYDTKQDLLDTLVLYFKTGLEHNEFCLWVVSQPLTVEEAKRALGQAVSDFDRHLAEGNLEIQGHEEWYLPSRSYDPERVLKAWREKLDQALARGHAGLRASGDTSWIQKDQWKAFREYEKELNALAADQRMLILCTYPLATCPGTQIFDAARIHQMVVARRHGRWETVETPELKQAKAEIKRLNDELERKVEDRTRELATANEALRSEIAERKLAVEAIQKAEDRIRLIIDTIPTMAWSLLPDGTVDFVNQRWLDYTGLSLEQELEEPTRPLHPADLPRVMEKWRADIAAGEPREDELRLRRADGEYRWFLVRTVPLRDERGNIVKWYGTSTDIEDRKRAEAKLRQREEYLRVLLKNVPVAVYTCDRQGLIEYYNTRAVEMWGRAPVIRDTMQRYCGSFALYYMDGRPMPFEENIMAQVIKTGIPQRDQEVVIERPDRTRVIALVNVAPLRNERGDVIGAVNCILDISARKRAEDALKNSYDNLRALSARLQSVREEEATRIAREIHDELGQSLTGLKMDLLWAERKLGERESSSAINGILDRVVGATELVDSLIATVQKIATELRPGVLDELGLGTALQYEARRFQERTGVPCDVRLPATEPILSKEQATALFRIFQESLTNVARHANTTKAEVEFRVEDGLALLQIRDDGSGITEADIASPESLGLLGMKERAEMLGGQITFKRNPDRGTSVTVRIPQTHPTAHSGATVCTY